MRRIYIQFKKSVWSVPHFSVSPFVKASKEKEKERNLKMLYLEMKIATLHSLDYNCKFAIIKKTPFDRTKKKNHSN